MLGLAFYALSAIGLGAALPQITTPDFREFGIRFVTGFALLILSLFILHVLVGLSLPMTTYAICGLAALGFAKTWISSGFKPIRLATLIHPGVVLLAIGAGAILVNGGVHYIPTTNDEFTNWLANSQIIHFSGGLLNVMDQLVLPDYPPGWRLLMLPPWQFDGAFAPGMSASAPFVLHVAVIAFIYDIVCFYMHRETELDGRTVRIWAWAVVLLFLAAEGIGRLWPLYLLIEPPQIYLYVAVFLTALLVEVIPACRWRLLAIASILVAASYMIKAAVLTLVVGWLPLLGLMLFFADGASRLRNAVAGMALVVAPTVLVMLIWSTFKVGTGCIGSPFQLLEQGLIPGRDYTDLTYRLVVAIAQYLAGYKTVLSIAAVGGMLCGWLFLGSRFTVVGFLSFSAVYFLALITYHWFCFTGEVEFTNLVSIPRYSRVIVQTGHALGLVLLVLAALRLPLASWKRFVVGTLSARHMIAIALIAILFLGGWQVRQIYRSVVDISYRNIFPIDYRVPEMQRAAELIRREIGRRLPDYPRVIVVDQGSTPEAPFYLRYFARTKVGNSSGYAFEVERRMAWTPRKRGNYETVTTREALKELFTAAHVIWPLKVDDWVIRVLRDTGVADSCLQALDRHVLMKASAESPFDCIERPKPVDHQW